MKRIVNISFVAVCFLLLTLNFVFCASFLRNEDIKTQYENISENELIQKLGKPTHEIKKARIEFKGEFYIGLQNEYPLSNPKNDSLIIRELNWNRGEENFTFWLHKVDHKWKVFEALFWLSGTDF